jgi:hypothetical protein
MRTRPAVTPYNARLQQAGCGQPVEDGRDVGGLLVGHRLIADGAGPGGSVKKSSLVRAGLVLVMTGEVRP